MHVCRCREVVRCADGMCECTKWVVWVGGAVMWSWVSLGGWAETKQRKTSRIVGARASVHTQQKQEFCRSRFPCLFKCSHHHPHRHPRPSPLTPTPDSPSHPCASYPYPPLAFPSTVPITMLHHRLRGYELSASSMGRSLLVFLDPEDAIVFATALQSALMAAPWSDELLTHEEASICVMASWQLPPTSCRIVDDSFYDS